MDEEEVDGMLAELTETYMSRIDEVATSAAGNAVMLAEKRLEEKLMAKIPKVYRPPCSPTTALQMLVYANIIPFSEIVYFSPRLADNEREL